MPPCQISRIGLVCLFGNRRNLPNCQILTAPVQSIAFTQVHAQAERLSCTGGRQEQRLVWNVVDWRNPRWDKRQRTLGRIARVLKFRKQRLPAAERVGLGITAIEKERPENESMTERGSIVNERTIRAEECTRPGRPYNSRESRSRFHPATMR